jgi:disulfide bond formation protein DsbB
MLSLSTPHQTARFIAAVLFIIIVGAWIFELAGYPPCELCLMQRWAYYVGVPFAAFLALARPSWIKWGLLALALMLAANAVFGVYHSGVEWKWWAGPAACSGGTISQGLPDLTKPGVMCNEAAIRILGLSLAGWNAVISSVLALLALRAIQQTPK